MRSLTTALVLLAAVIVQAGAQSVCPGNGALTLATTGGRLGDPFSLTLSGTPNVSGLLGLDLAGGPVITALGNVCFGLTPALQLQSFTLDPAGGFGIAGLVPPSPPLAGLSMYMQAAANDATQPAGFALSNATRADLRPPHVHAISNTLGAAGGGPLPMGKWARYDVLADAFAPVVTFPANIVHQAAVPAFGWLALLLGNGTVAIHDATAATSVLTVTLPPASAAWARLGVVGTTLLVHDPGSLTASAALRAYTLSSGALAWAVSVPANSGMIVPPGGTTVYLNYGAALLPVDVATGAFLPSILIGFGPSALTEAVFNGAFMYCLMTGSGLPTQLNVVDTFLQAPVYPAAVTVPTNGTASMLRFGPGTAGPSLFLRDVSPSATTILPISPVTLALTATPIPAPAPLAAMELSNGGTEWLLICNSGTCGFPANAALLVMNPSTLAITTVGAVPSGVTPHLRPVPSASFNKAYVGANGNNKLVHFATDPATTISPVTTVPVPSVGLRLVVD